MDEALTGKQLEDIIKSKGLDATIRDHTAYMIATRSEHIEVTHIKDSCKLKITFTVSTVKQGKK